VEPQKTSRKRASKFIKDVVAPAWQPSRDQVLWATRIMFVLVVVLGILTLIGQPFDVTLWNWLKLLIVPVVLAVGGYLFTRSENRATQAAAERRAQDEALQGYLDHIGQLLLDKDRPLRQSKERDEVRTLARAQTLSVLPRLDGVRKATVVRFLYESGLIEKGRAVLDLSGADLARSEMSQANLSGANLSRANLNQASLHKANLSAANLSEANLLGARLGSTVAENPGDLGRVSRSGHRVLEGANLSGADLTMASLHGADLNSTKLNNADLSNAKLYRANLNRADLSGADLRGSDLSRANLLNADLSNADLSGAFLTQARLVGTNLIGATLIGADLHALRGGNPKLRKANLREADLSRAILSGADLREADLSLADLSLADLSKADLYRADLSMAILRGAQGTTRDQLDRARTLRDATMPDGHSYGVWLKGQ
jgi:uncharacterized protein YjbI with pentapeptide repeats